MPQFNHYETKSGRIIDPTFGLDALDAETKRKTKAREQMNTAAMVLRQSLGQRGKGLSEGTVATVSEGGGIEFTGDNAAADESRLYSTGTANYGKSGKGTTVKETQKRAALDALASQFNTRVAQANQSQAGMQAVGNNAIGAYNATTLNTTLPTNTAPGTQTPATTTLPTPVSPTTATILGGVLPSSLISPIYRPGVSAPLSNTQPTAAPTANASTTTQQQAPTSNSMQAGTSVSFSSGGGTNSYSGSTEIDNTTESDIEVRDQLNMNQSDLAVNDAMQALAFHLSGGQSPGTFRSMMAQNADTMKTTNEALAKQGTSETIRAGIGESQSSSASSPSISMSKNQKASSGGGAQKPQLPTVNFVQSSSGQRNVAATVLPNGNYKMQAGTGVMFRNANLVSQIGASSGLLYNKQPDGSYSLAKGSDEKKGIDNMYNQHAAAMENYQHLDGHRWEKKEVNGKKYVSFQKEVNGKWEEIGYHEYDAMHPVYTDGKNVESTVGNFAAGSTYKPMPKLTARPGKYGASGTHVELTQAEADLLYGDQGQ